MKILILILISLCVTSCGQVFGSRAQQDQDPATYADGGPLYVDRSRLPLTMYVNEDKYNQYKAQFDETESTLTSRSGIELVQFVPRPEDPKFSSVSETSSLYNSGGEMWVMFKETGFDFQDISSDTLGLAYYGYSNNSIYWGQIIMNFTIGNWSPDNFRQVLLHEVNHVLGFDHIVGSEVSVMNYDWALVLDGISTSDYYRLYEKYPFSYHAIIIKDLEMRGADREIAERSVIRDRMVTNFGLSYERAEEVSDLLYNYQKVQRKRSLTLRERNILTQGLLGIKYTTAKKALEDHIGGNSQSFDDLVEKAADINGITPEHVQDLISETLGG